MEHNQPDTHDVSTQKNNNETKIKYRYCIFFRSNNLRNCHDAAHQKYNHMARKIGMPILPQQLHNPNGHLSVLYFNSDLCPLTLDQIREKLVEQVMPWVHTKKLRLKFSRLGKKTGRVFLSDGSVLSKNYDTFMKEMREKFAEVLKSLGCRVVDDFQPYLSLYTNEEPLPENMRAVCRALNQDKWTRTVSLADAKLDVYEDVE